MALQDKKTLSGSLKAMPTQAHQKETLHQLCMDHRKQKSLYPPNPYVEKIEESLQNTTLSIYEFTSLPSY